MANDRRDRLLFAGLLGLTWGGLGRGKDLGRGFLEAVKLAFLSRHACHCSTFSWVRQ